MYSRKKEESAASPIGWHLLRTDRSESVVVLHHLKHN